MLRCKDFYHQCRLYYVVFSHEWSLYRVKFVAWTETTVIALNLIENRKMNKFHHTVILVKGCNLSGRMVDFCLFLLSYYECWQATPWPDIKLNSKCLFCCLRNLLHIRSGWKSCHHKKNYKSILLLHSKVNSLFDSTTGFTMLDRMYCCMTGCRSKRVIVYIE